VEDKLLVELKWVDRLANQHTAQCLNYFTLPHWIHYAQQLCMMLREICAYTPAVHIIISVTFVDTGKIGRKGGKNSRKNLPDGRTALG